MSIDNVAHFLRQTPVDPASAWMLDALQHLSTRAVPDVFFRERKTLLMADQTRLWLRWFLEGLVTPVSFVEDNSKTKLHIFEVALQNIRLLYPNDDMHQQRELADVVAEHLFADVQRQRTHRTRDYATNERKRELIEATSQPRCYLCGYAFSQEARDRFLGVKGHNAIQLPALVDILRPRGVKTRDLTIEIEHLVPVAGGGSGQGNLHLACGWCNRYKGARTSLYEASFVASRGSFRIGHRKLYELPEPFWTIRLLAVQSRCQHVGGCTATTKDEELFPALRDWEGSPNPTNLRFYCATHDPIAIDRFVSRPDAERLWSERIRG